MLNLRYLRESDDVTLQKGSLASSVRRHHSSSIRPSQVSKVFFYKRSVSVPFQFQQTSGTWRILFLDRGRLEDILNTSGSMAHHGFH